MIARQPLSKCISVGAGSNVWTLRRAAGLQFQYCKGIKIMSFPEPVGIVSRKKTELQGPGLASSLVLSVAFRIMKCAALLGVASLLGVARGAPAGDSSSVIESRAAAGLLGTSPYTPVKGQACPAGGLIRSATGINTKEAAYVKTRSSNASKNLVKYLKSTGQSFNTTGELPTLAIAFSGGGLRAQLVGAGVRQAFDSRDSKLGVAGIYQSLTYESGLSGGSWLLGSISGNNYPTISYLRDNIWENTLQAGLLLPGNFSFLISDAVIIADVADKQSAGFTTTIVDFWGRLQGYTFLPGINGGVAITYSDVASTSNFTAHNVPFPIITALGVEEDPAMCQAVLNSTQFEVTPYEFGSWDKAVHAFTPTKYLGTTLNNGKAASSKSCVTKYDNLGFIMGTSSNVFPAGLCPLVASPSAADVSEVEPQLEALLAQVHNPAATDLQAIYPNPFYKFAGTSAKYSSTKNLALADGGTGGQNDPIWPFLYRPDVEVLFVSDNSADTANYYPNGVEIYQTYLESIAAGLTRMPVIPPTATFLSTGLNKRPTFFGCNDASKLTIVWIPNINYTFNSGQSTFRLQYNKADTSAMIANGNKVANYGGKKDWPTCIGCAVMKKTGNPLPAACTACFQEYCYN